MTQRMHGRRRDLGRYGLFAFLLLILLLFLIWPIALTVGGGFVDEATGGFTLRYFIGEGVGVLRDPLYQQGLVNALAIAVATTTLCLLVTLPMGLIAARYHFPGKALVSALVLVPLILPPFVGAIGMQFLLNRFGAINALLGKIGLLDPDQPGIDFMGGGALPWLPGGGRFWAVVVMEALHLYPILYLNIVAALANLDPSLDEAALNLGAGKWKRFWRCTLPLILPGVFAGSTIVFIWSFTELGTPLMFEYKTVTPVQVFYGLTDIEANPRPYALVVVMLTVAVLLYLLGKFAFGGRAYAMQSKATAAVAERRLTGWRGIGALVLFVGVTLLAVLPHLGVVLASVTVDGTCVPVRSSARVHAVALQRRAQPRAGDAVDRQQPDLRRGGDGAVHPAGPGDRVPDGAGADQGRLGARCVGDAAAGRAGPGDGLRLCGDEPALALQRAAADASGRLGRRRSGVDLVSRSARSSRSGARRPTRCCSWWWPTRSAGCPTSLRSASAGLEQTSGDLEEAALNLGASPMTAIRRVVVPLIMANLIAGGILVFSFAMLEVSDSLILAEKAPHYPITKAIWELFNRLGDGKYIASAMGVWAMALLTITLVGASVLMGKRLGAIFRV